MAKDKVKPQSKRGLFLIAVLLIGSGVVRLGTHTGQAFAREDATLPELTEVTSTTLSSADFDAAVEVLQEREARVEEKEIQLEARLKVLADAEVKFDASRAALVLAEEQLAKTISKAETAMKDDVEQLAKVYEKMKPKDAAALFAQMSPEFAAGFMALINSETAAKILSGLEPPAAYAISVLLAGRNANVPKN